MISWSFFHQNPSELEDWLSDLNPRSKEVVPEAYAVPSLVSAVVGDKFQFERLGNIWFLYPVCPRPKLFNVNAKFVVLHNLHICSLHTAMLCDEPNIS